MSDKYLHLFTDNFIVDSIVARCDNASPGNRYIVFARKSRFVKSKRVEFFDSYRQLKASGIDVAQFKRIFVHYLGGDAVRFILDHPEFDHYYWFFWGADGYALDELKGNLYLGLTHEWLTRNRPGLVARIKKVLREYLFPVSDNKKLAIARIAYVCTYIDGDVELVRRAVDTRMKQIFFTYQSVTELAGEGTCKKCDLSHVKFLIGNSINPTNNHLDVFDFLGKISSRTGSELYIPLSYSGEEQYAAMVKQRAFELFDRVVPLDTFVPPEEYQKIMTEVDVAVFFHVRQQASNTALGLLWLGKLLIMRSESTLFQKFRSWGLSVVSSDEIMTQKDLENRLLQFDDRWSRNREILNELFSEAAVRKCYDVLFEEDKIY